MLKWTYIIVLDI